MPKKTRKEKEELVEHLKEKISMQKAAVLTKMSGLTVAEITDLRRKIREAGGEFKVTKISLLKIASKGSPLEPIVKDLTGSTALVFAYEDPVPVTKAIKGFSEKIPKIEAVSGVLGEKAISSEDVYVIADLPSKDELIAKMVVTIAAPLTGLVGVLSAIPRYLLYSLNAIKHNKENQ